MTENMFCGYIQRQNMVNAGEDFSRGQRKNVLRKSWL